MQRLKFLALLSAAAWSATASGQAPASSLTVFEGARVIIGDGRPPIENASFVVNGARFAQVGRAADVKAPPGAARVSLAGKTVMPAIIDTHTHLSQTREALTDDLIREAYATFERIDAIGGMIPAIEQGIPQREIAESAYRFQQAVERREQVIVGVNDFVADDEPIEILYIDETATERQLARLAEVKARRSQAAVARALDGMRHAAEGSDNLLPPILDAVRAYATIGEMCDALRTVWGEWEESAVI